MAADLGPNGEGATCVVLRACCLLVHDLQAAPHRCFLCFIEMESLKATRLKSQTEEIHCLLHDVAILSIMKDEHGNALQ